MKEIKKNTSPLFSCRFRFYEENMGKKSIYINIIFSNIDYICALFNYLIRWDKIICNVTIPCTFSLYMVKGSSTLFTSNWFQIVDTIRTTPKYTLGISNVVNKHKLRTRLFVILLKACPLLYFTPPLWKFQAINNQCLFNNTS